MRLLAYVLLALMASCPVQGAVPIGVPVPVHVMVCDTLTQAVEILSVHAEQGYEAGIRVLALYEHMVNEEGEPICGNLRAEAVVEKKMGTFPNLDFPSGVKSVYILRIRLGDSVFYALSFTDIEGTI